MIWYDKHCYSLRHGASRRRELDTIAEQMGNPRYSQLLARFKAWRKNAKVTNVTKNLRLSYLRALFNELSRLDEVKAENPFSSIRRLPVDQVELVYLDDDQVVRLLEECDASGNPDTGKVTRVCLATGARWSEAEQIRAHHVKQGRLLLSSQHTKNRKPRTIPIDRCVQAQFSMKPGRQFRPCYDAYRRALQRTEIVLPKGQLSHVLRHTFASSFLARGGNIRVLQSILDHASLETTMRYAHFMPDHLEQALQFNPLSIG